MTILTVIDSDGVRRCNTLCHNAAGSVCKCCCGGFFHGAGRRGDFADRVYTHLAGLAAELQEMTSGRVIVTWPLVQRVLPFD